MTRWRRSSTRRPGRDRPSATGRGRKGRAAARAKNTAAAVVDEYDGLILLRASAEALPRPDDIAELARFLADDKAAPDVFTVVVGAEGAGADLWTRLVGVFDSLRERGVSTVRLALSGAGGDRPGRPAMAQRLADAWGIEVIAPAAGVMIVPGGSLFALGTDPPEPGWRSFRPGMKPTPLGRRSPAPLWQSALARLSGQTAQGWVVEQVPAGIFVRPGGVPRAGNLCYAVPVDGDHLTVLVGGSESDDTEIPAQDLAALLVALPETTRSGVRLAPCGSADLLPVGQDTAEILGTEVEVLTGLPLVIGSDTEPEVRPVVIGADAEPTWVPFVEAVACRPYGADGTDRVPAPRLVRWHSPVSDADRTESSGALPLSDRWQVNVTRAGLVVGPRGEAPAFAGRPVSAEQMAVEVDLRGEAADDALFADLSRVLSELDKGARKFVVLHQVLPSHRTDGEDFRLLRLAVEHGVSLAESPSAETAPAPAVPNVRTVAIPPARPAGQSTSPTPSPETRTEFAEPATASATEGVSAASPAPERAAYGPAPSVRPEPSSPPEPRPSAPVPSASAPDTPPRAVPDAPGRPFQADRAEPLSPLLGSIPLTPVTPSEQSAPPEPSRPAEPVSPASKPAAPLQSSSPARTSPSVPSSLRLPSSAAEKVAGSLAGATEPSEPSEPTSSGPVTPAASPSPAPAASPDPSPATVRPAPAPAARGSRDKVSAKPVRRSTDAERAEFRSLAQPIWERHSASVNRAMTRMPVLRGAQMDAARADLVAVHIYLSGDAEELKDTGPHGPACYLACLGSGLCRLPSYRGVAVRGGLPEGGLERLAPGSVLREPGPVGALPIGTAADLPVRTGGYVIWSSTGRRVRPLLGTTPGVASDEVVFPPGATFRVLEVRSAGPAPVVLLSEVPGTAPVDDRPSGLDDADRATLERLDEALRKQESSAGGASLSTWPARCAGALFAGTSAPG